MDYDDQTGKQALRRRFYALRRQAAAGLPGLAGRLNDAIAVWLEGLGAATAVGFYRPFRGEPDITPAIVRWARGSGARTLAVPVVDDVAGGRMHFCPWTPQTPMVRSTFGIEEPADAAAVCEPGVVFSPCVGVNRAGFRLGNGGGFFDRYLAARPRVTAVAVAWDCLVADIAWQQPHDIAFDFIATESGVRPAEK